MEMEVEAEQPAAEAGKTQTHVIDLCITGYDEDFALKVQSERRQAAPKARGRRKKRKNAPKRKKTGSAKTGLLMGGKPGNIAQTMQENKRKRMNYRADNADRIKEYQWKYYADNTDEILEQQRKYYADNNDEILEQQQKHENPKQQLK